MSRLAGAVGISAPALYWHFSSKHEIYHQAMRMVLEDFSSYVKTRIRPVGPATQLEDLVRAHVSWQLKEQELAGAFAHSANMVSNSDFLEPDQRQDLIRIQRDYIAVVQQILQRGQDAGAFKIANIRLTTMAIITLLEGVQSWYNPRKDLSPDTVATSYVAMVMNIVQHTGRE